MIDIHPTAIIYPGVEIEEDVVIGPYCVIGGRPEHRQFFNKKTDWGVRICTGARLSEFVTVHSGTEHHTVIGSGTAIFQKTHVAHDCILEDRVIVGGMVSLAGHTYAQEGANISGHSATIPYVVIGAYSFLGAASLLTKHLAPGEKAVGFPARVVGYNEVGLQRAGLNYDNCVNRFELRWDKLLKGRPLL